MHNHQHFDIHENRLTIFLKAWRTERWYVLVRARSTIPQKQIAIVNPIHKKNTGDRAARSLIERGHAKWEVFGRSIRLVEELHIRARQQVDAIEAEIARNRGGVVYWNGADVNRAAMHKPGECRS